MKAVGNQVRIDSTQIQIGQADKIQVVQYGIDQCIQDRVQCHTNAHKLIDNPFNNSAHNAGRDRLSAVAVHLDHACHLRIDAVGSVTICGVFVASITEPTPASDAGFENGDVIFEIEGHRIWNDNRFFGVVSGWPQGETIRFKVRRKGKVHELKVFLGDPAKIRNRKLAASPVDLGFLPAPDFDDLGIEVDSIEKDGPVARAGMAPGDVIIKVGERRVTTWAEFRRTVASRKPGSTLRLTYLRDEERKQVDVRIPLKVDE